MPFILVGYSHPTTVTPLHHCQVILFTAWDCASYSLQDSKQWLGYLRLYCTHLWCRNECLPCRTHRDRPSFMCSFLAEVGSWMLSKAWVLAPALPSMSTEIRLLSNVNQVRVPAKILSTVTASKGFLSHLVSLNIKLEICSFSYEFLDHGSPYFQLRQHLHQLEQRG